MEVLAVKGWSDGLFLFGGRIGTGVTSELEMEAVVNFPGLVMAGVVL